MKIGRIVRRGDRREDDEILRQAEEVVRRRRREDDEILRQAEEVVRRTPTPHKVAP
jgi:hypothetical protein